MSLEPAARIPTTAMKTAVETAVAMVPMRVVDMRTRQESPGSASGPRIQG